MPPDSVDSEVWDPVEFKVGFRSALRHFRREAAQAGKALEGAFADAMQYLFPDSEVTIVVQEGGETKRVRGARSSEPGHVFTLTEQNVKSFIEDNSASTPLLFDINGLSCWYKLGDSECVLCLAAGGKAKEWEMHPGPLFWIFVAGIASSVDRENLKHWGHEIEELRDLYDHLESAVSIPRVPQFHRRLERIQHDGATLLSERFSRCSDAVYFIASHLSVLTAASIVRRCDALGQWAVQEVLGSNWHVGLGDGAANWRGIEQLFDALYELIISARSRLALEADLLDYFERRIRAYASIACLPESLQKSERLDLGTESVDVLSLLGRWTRLERYCFELSRRAQLRKSAFDDDWWHSIELTRKPLREHLAKGWNGGSEQDRERVQGFGAWLGAWGAGEILDHMAHRLKDGQRSLSVLESKLLPSDRWRLRAHVSLLLREALRQIAFRDSTDFHFDATAYLEALSGVVEHHAHFILGLPWGIDLRNLLRSSGESRDADDHPFMASYLQHALQLYLAGLFLADVQVKGRFGGGRTLLGVLASQGLEPGTGALRELRQAYALAALFHDAGMLLFPRVFFPNQELPQGDRSVRERLRHVRQEVDSAAQDLMAECERELVSEQYFDPQKERSIAGWLRVETEAGRYDHSLVGAWYLHRVACTVVPFEVLRPAVRAILLHQIVAQPISSQQDPTAALLVLCDELMDWRPSGRPKGGLAAGFPDLGSRSLDVRREGSRAQSIRFPQLTYRNDCWEMQVASGEPFPLVEITLREPDHLTMPVYQIWFLMLQNLVRVIDDSSRQWQPEVTVTSSVPGNLAARDTNHQEVLGILARTSRHPCRAFLETWLQRLTNESVGTQTSPGAIVRERFRLSAGRDEIWTESLAYALAPLAVDYENVVREIPILPKR